MATGPLKLVSIVLLALNWCSWVIFLGGLAGFTSYCNDKPENSRLVSEAALYVEDFGHGKCKNYYALPWWALWFDFVVLIMVSTLFCVKQPVLIRSTLLYLTMVSGLMMIVANDANLLLDPLNTFKKKASEFKIEDCKDGSSPTTCSNANDKYDNVNGAYMSVQAMLAGLCMVLIFNMLTIILESGYELDAPVQGAQAAPAQVVAGKAPYTSNPTYVPGSIQMQPGTPVVVVPTTPVQHMPHQV